MKNWKHKDVWKIEGRNFAVEVSRHESRMPEEMACFDSEGPHRWCVYVYIYPKHPRFGDFDPDGQMYDQPTFGMHCGNSYFRTWRSGEGKITAFQVGSDYNHDGDWSFTRKATKDDAYQVFADAEEIAEALTMQELPVIEDAS